MKSFEFTHLNWLKIPLNCSPCWLEKSLEFTRLKMHFNLSTMLCENFETYSSQLGKNVLKLSTMVGENFGTDSFQLAKTALK